MNDQSPVVSALPDYALRTSSVSPPSATTAPGGCADCGRPAPGGCANCGRPAVADPSPPPAFAYAVGRLHARFPSMGAEREYAQLAGAEPDAIVRTADLKSTLTAAEHRYLARQMCWVCNTPGGDAFVVVPRDDRDLDELLDALGDDEATVQVVVGSPATASSAAAACLVTGLPAVAPDQLLVFRRDELFDALPTPGDGKDLRGKDAEVWRATATGLFDHLTRRSDNRGLSDSHRAMNYVALRYPQIYHLAFERQQHGSPLIGVEARPVASGERRTVEIRFTFRNTSTHVVERYLCRVDVTDNFPFLTISLTLTYD